MRFKLRWIVSSIFSLIAIILFFFNWTMSDPTSEFYPILNTLVEETVMSVVGPVTLIFMWCDCFLGKAIIFLTWLIYLTLQYFAVGFVIGLLLEKILEKFSSRGRDQNEKTR